MTRGLRKKIINAAELGDLVDVDSLDKPILLEPLSVALMEVNYSYWQDASMCSPKRIGVNTAEINGGIPEEASHYRLGQALEETDYIAVAFYKLDN